MNPITAPGVYDIEIERYHHDATLCDGPSISASGLKAVDDCAARYWATSPYNPNRVQRKETTALNLGRAAHAVVLGEPEFLKYFIVSPYEEFRTNQAKEWRDAQTCTILKAPEFEIVLAMAKSQRESPYVMQAFERGRAEQSLIWKDAETGIWLKARPDWLPDDPSQRFVVDYKTAVTIEPRKLSSDAFKFGYHIQAGLQMDGLQFALGIKRPLGIAHVVQEKEPPFLCDLRMFQPEQLDLGRLIYRRALRKFADCMSSGKWPGYTADPQYFETPRWIAAQLEEFSDDDDGNGATPTGRSYTPGDYLRAG